MIQGTHEKNGIELAAWDVTQIARVADSEVDSIIEPKLIRLRLTPGDEFLGKVYGRDPVAALRKRCWFPRSFVTGFPKCFAGRSWGISRVVSSW